MTELTPAEAVFFAAAALPPADRHAYLSRVCAENDDLRRRVERMLAARPEVGNFLEPPIAPRAECATGTFAPAAPPTAPFGSDNGATSDLPGRDEHVGAVLGGKYKLVEEIGEGGMGSVFMAQQTEPVKRAVAVKVIKAGMDSKAVLARFEAERQALALMDHPNIARVLDAGTTEGGRPYFVMELVKGIPITQYCDDRKLTPRQRLELFVPVCHAIQHAHMKGVIHRDIKPSNVLVALYDDRPVPKVIDFGVAKAAGPTLTDKTLMTGFGAVVGTPEYMSPEQANLNNLDIDTRSDVYSLGVLLYELLTGTTPVDRKSLGKAALLEVLRIVREVEAPRPSNKLSSAATPPSVAANRGTEPAKLSKLMKGELDWVVLKALEKDRTRRYESANGLARDVQRYLADEVVEARPPSAGYRVRKFVRRHKGRVAVTTAFLALLVVSAAVSSWLALQAKRAEAVAEDRRIEAEANAKEAEANSLEVSFQKGVISGQADHLQWALVNSKLDALSSRVDLDAAESRTDPRIGLLRRTRTLRDLSQIELPTGFAFLYGHVIDRRRDLREFVTAAVLTTGQNYAPLLPPLTHDGYAVLWNTLSPDSKTCLTIGADGSARIWESRTAKPLATLREGAERVVQVGFSPDGKIIYTSDSDSILRFWNSADCTFRAKTELSPNRYVYPNGLAFHQLPFVAPTANRVAMTNTRVLTQSQPVSGNAFRKGEDIFYDGPCRPAELWDTASGRLVARFDHPGSKGEDCRLANNGNWIATVQEKTRIVLVSADDGRELGRLLLPHGEEISGFDVSPNGHRIQTRSQTTGIEPTYHQRIWKPYPWRIIPDPVLDQWKNSDGIYFLTDNLVRIYTSFEYGNEAILYRIGEVDSKTFLGDKTVETTCNDELLVLNDDRIFDGKTLKRLAPPAGRKYPPSLTRLARDGRFVFRESGIRAIDAVTEKQIEFKDGWEVNGHSGYFPAWGTVAVGRGCEIRVIPSPKILDVPPALLELWAQVAVRGELGPDGEFVKWTEQTWEKKRQELAAIPPPHPDFPFPGYVVTDKLHWLRAEYEAAAEKDKLRLAADLLRRSEESGDNVEAVRWRAETDRLSPHVAPSPREK
ncbi:serine/threonine-protein kinase [Frigoriglobus tundricola]|uniref:Protein kinase domain-containing protein n=1 Tax=Frigoriglobus tundricola TaxID=2774151 RepID=A0A6M5Z5U6_9BACT|nr:serine/threonine-protein kinase [Frigoriglobus tundricola]QJX01065.1 hypothetical protein FTUN_8704 [Frigoriglobus tundricola]